jgi:hypothetical protein
MRIAMRQVPSGTSILRRALRAVGGVEPGEVYHGGYLQGMVGLCEGEERVCLMCSEAVWWRCHRT